jgi:hypothetical protein
MNNLREIIGLPKLGRSSDFILVVQGKEKNN